MVKQETVGNHTFYCGHALDVLRGLPDESVHMILTSPPYWAVRKYAGDQARIWGGDPDCEHEWAENFCAKCGAWRGELGLEPTVELYIEHLVEIFREYRRVLRSDGTLWLNIGDTYIGSRQGPKGGEYVGHKGEGALARLRIVPEGHVSCNLALVPQRLALALQADGWIIRSMIVWAKGTSGQKELRGQVYDACIAAGVDEETAWAIVDNLDPYQGNPLPESVKDRPTKAHEYIILASKATKPQFWTHPEKQGTRKRPEPDYVEIDGRSVNLWRAHKYYYDYYGIQERGTGRASCLRNYRYDGMVGHETKHGLVKTADVEYHKRALRDVWTIPTEPSSVPHYAVMPSRLAAICIRAGTSEEGCCPVCGASYVRQVRPVGKAVCDGRKTTRCNSREKSLSSYETVDGVRTTATDYVTVVENMGWVPTCDCEHDEPVPCIVLDPFGGVGTTSLVCEELGRGSIYIDISEEYRRIAIERMREKLKQPRLL